jgi:4-amino-4-deoxy-L-arabinose transferase-like glycosyltransferase
MLLFVPLLAVVATLTVARAPAERIALLVAALVAALLVITPWVGFNLARFKDTTFLSTNDGLTLAGSNCHDVWYAQGIGLWTTCPGPVPPGDQSQQARVYRDRAFDYIDAHRGRLPIVALARIGRTWGLFRPGDMVGYNTKEDREEWVSRLGFITYYPTLILAVVGAVFLFRSKRRRELWVLLVPVIVVTVFTAVTYGQTRFRAAAEPSLAILAAVAIVALVRTLRSPEERPQGEASELEPASA